MPGYHDYPCLSADAAALVETLEVRDMVLIVQIRIADERTHHRLCQIPSTPVSDIIELAGRSPKLSIVAMCAQFQEAVEIAKSTSNVSFDLSHIEKMRTLPSFLRQVPVERVMFGSHTPFLTLRSAKMKLMAPGISEVDRRKIACENARRIFRSSVPKRATSL